MKRRFLSVLLSLCLVLGLLPTAAFAQGKRYVALGDSITAGYGLQGGEKSFAELVAEENGYTLNNENNELAKEGATSVDLLAVVQDEENTDILKSADLITITIGGNDLMAALYEFLANAYNAANQTDFTGNDVRDTLAGEEDPPIEKIGLLLVAVSVIGDFPDSQEAQEALSDLADNFQAVISTIKTLNQNATIIVANQYHPYSHIESTAAAAIVDAFGAGVTALNAVIDSGTGYEVADVYTVFREAAENPCNAYVNSLSDFDLDFHPNAYGHELMADVISNLLKDQTPPEGEDPEPGEPGGEEQPEPQVESLWVNGENVLTADDYTVACGGGTAEYDPADNTLTLNNATIDTGYEFVNEYGPYIYGIYAEGDLTIVLVGDNTISNDQLDYGIRAQNELTIRGGDSLTITGAGYAIFARENLTIGETAQINASTDMEQAGYHCINSFEKVIIEGSPTISAEAIPNNYSIRADNGITVGGETYYVNRTPDEISYAKIEDGRVVSGLHTPTVYINGMNMSEYKWLPLGEGWASYDPGTGTLKLHDATITKPYIYTAAYYEVNNLVGIYADTDLTIILEGTNTIQGSDIEFAFFLRGDTVTICGSGSLAVYADYYGIYAYSGVTIQDTTVALNVVDGDGISAGDKGVAIKDSTVTIDVGGTGITAPSIDIMNSRVDITAGTYGLYSSNGGSSLEIHGDASNVSIKSSKTAVFLSSITITGGTVDVVSTSGHGITATMALTITGGKLTAIGEYSGILVSFYPLVLEGGSVTAIGQGEGSYGILAYGLTMEQGSTLTASGAQAALFLNDKLDLPDGYLPAGYHIEKVSATYDDRDGEHSVTVYTIARDGATVTYDYDPYTGTVTFTGAAKSVLLTDYAAREDDRDTGSTTESERNPDGSLTTTVTNPDGTTVETTRYSDGSKEVVETQKDGTVVTTATDKDGNETRTTENTDGTSEIVKTSVATADGVVLTLSGGETVKLVDNSKTFSDVTSNFWGTDAVAFASSRELFNGTSATAFSPNAPMDRAMIVTVLARLDGADTSTGSTWYEAGVQWAVTSGISDGSGLDQNLTREQLATMLYRYAQLKGYDVSVGNNTNILSYADASSVSSYAMEAMQWACGAGIIGGKDGLLDPAGSATRAEVATMLMRFVAGLREVGNGA